MCSLQVLSEVASLSGHDKDAAETMATSKNMAFAVFSSVPWITARTVDNADGSFTFTPLSIGLISSHTLILCYFGMLFHS